MTHLEKSSENLLSRIRDLEVKLQEAEDTLDAIRTGSVDAVAIRSAEGTKIYTLEGADETYRALVENMSEAAVTLNVDGMILFSNAHFSQLVNVPLNNIIGISFENFIPDEYHKELYALLNKGWLETTKGEFVLQPREKDLLHIHLSIKSISTKDMTVLGLIITDLSERKELEKLAEAKKNLDLMNIELTDKNRQLTKTNFDLDSFIYTASHDLKAPISNIEGLIITMKSVLEEAGLMKDDISVIMSMMSSSVLKFKKTIIDLTEISKTQKDFQEDVSSLNIEEIIEDVKDSIHSMIKDKRVNISVDTQSCPEIRFSSKNLKSIVYNLISNAIKYSSPHRIPEVVIRAEQTHEHILLTVQDNGLGIRREDRNKVFSMFKRLHDHVEGTGVGLYIVKRIVDNAGGKIEIESEPGHGSTFKVFFLNEVTKSKDRHR